MNIKKCVVLLSGGLFLSLTAVSCGGSDDPASDITEAITPSSFSYVEDENGVGKVFSGPTYRVAFDNDTKKAVVKMENIRWTDNGSASSYSFSDIDWKFNPDNDARVIDAVTVRADSDGVPQVTNLAITMFQPYSDGENLTLDGMTVGYTIDGHYNVTNIPYQTVYVGATETVTVTDDGAGTDAYVSTTPVYTVDIDPTRGMAVLGIKGAAFAEQMPRMDMEFGSYQTGDGDDKPVTLILREGGFSLHCDKLIPTIKGTPFPKFVITNLTMDVDLDGESRLEFECMGIYRVTACFEAVYSN